MPTLVRQDIKKAFQMRVADLFESRVNRFVWIADDPHEPTGETLPHVFHASLHLSQATPQDVDAAADLACAIEDEFDNEFTILTHTRPVAE